MKKKSIYLLVFLLVIIIGKACVKQEDFKVVNLHCEYLSDPLHIDTDHPRFSWTINSELAGFEQQAYEIRVGMDIEKVEKNRDLVWQSGEVSSIHSNQIAYNGDQLKPNTQYYWQVRVWSNEEEVSDWSNPASFHTGHTAKTWQAQWIGLPVSQAAKDDYTCPPSPMLRYVFTIEKPIKKAILSASAKGIYEAWMNGEKIGQQYLAPGWTDYAQRIQYQTYPIGSLKTGVKNCISVVLADGWYAGRLGPIDWNFEGYPWRGWYGRDLRFLGQLDIWYEDGSFETIGTDESWQYFEDGPIRSADIFVGVEYDFNHEIEGWQMPDFDASAWKKVSVEKTDYSVLAPQLDQPIEVIKQLKPIAVEELGDQVYIVDMGQNMVGWLKIALQGEPSDTIVLKHGEMLNADGSVHRDNLRNAPQIDQYILADNTEQVIEPLFTFHGFRYVQIEGLRNAPDLSDITGIVLVSSTPNTGSFSCSNNMINKLVENIRWTQWGNQLSVPTDCPQRSERMGWMGDAQVFAQTAIYNHDMSAFYSKWGIDVIHAQLASGEFSDVSPRAMPLVPRFFNAPGWADAGLIVPFRLYENYGDVRVIERHYNSMKKYVDRIHELNPDLIYMNGTGHAYNDWLNGNTIISEDYPNTGGEVPRPVFNTAFFIRSTRLLAKAAEILNKTDDFAKYTSLAGQTLEKFQEMFLFEDGSITGDTQAGYAIALSFDLVPDELRPTVAKMLVDAIKAYDNRMSTGFISTICMMDELSEAGYHELACQLAESTRLPSWGYSIEQGATTIWERWDAYVKGRGFQNPGMNSFNHYTFGSIGEWLYKHVLGIAIDPESPGWKHFYLQPKMGGSFTWAKGHYQSIYGPISMDWKLNKNVLDVVVEIPANTRATFILPTGYITDVTIDENELIQIPPDRQIRLEAGKHTLKLIGK